MSRPSWDAYFLGIAEAVARRADCTRARVGAVIVKDHRIVAVGYNGSPAGEPGCATDGACPRGRATYDVVPSGAEYAGPGACIAVHAEANALLYADQTHCVGATIYVTHPPCDGCARLIKAAGVSHVVHPVVS